MLYFIFIFISVLQIYTSILISANIFSKKVNYFFESKMPGFTFVSEAVMMQLTGHRASESKGTHIG